MERTCIDKSDQIFPVNTSCTTKIYEEIFKDTICSADYVQKPLLVPAKKMYQWTNRNICANISKWINEKTTAEYLDPHDCQSSCKTPEYGCEACTNEEYSFQCIRNGTKVCLHKAITCDGHSQCDQAEDEDLELCLQIYLDKGFKALILDF